MRWSFEAAVVLCLIGVGVGAFGTVIGAGGGFILTPILLLLYPHDSAQTLTAISLAAVFFNAASGSVAYARQRRIDFHSGTVFAIATLPGAVAGALVLEASFQGLPIFVRLADVNVTLRTLGGPAILLLWLYVMANVIVFGAEVNWHRARH